MEYFTGPKEHSIATRRYARERGMKLNEYGLFHGKKNLARKPKKEIYDVLGLKFEKRDSADYWPDSEIFGEEIMSAGQPTLGAMPRFLQGVLKILQVPQIDIERRVQELDDLVRERALLRFAEDLSLDERQDLLKNTEGLTAEEKAKIFAERLVAKAAQAKDLYSQVLEKAAEELVPEYVQSVAEGATEDQRQQIIALAKMRGR